MHLIGYYNNNIIYLEFFKSVFYNNFMDYMILADKVKQTRQNQDEITRT